MKAAEVRTAHGGAVAPRHARREAAFRVVRVADHAVREPSEQRIEGVGSGLAHEPHEFRPRAELREPRGQRVARGVGSDDVDFPLDEQCLDAAARAPYGAEGARLDVIERDVHDRTAEGGEVVGEGARARADDEREDGGAVEVLDQERHAALPAHLEVRVVTDEGDADRVEAHDTSAVTASRSSSIPSLVWALVTTSR